MKVCRRIRFGRQEHLCVYGSDHGHVYDCDGSKVCGMWTSDPESKACISRPNT